MWLKLDILTDLRLLSILTFILLSFIFQHAIPIGIVGEVEPLWGPIPTTTLSSPLSCVGELCLYSTRPLLRWQDFPLMLNVYTGAFPDWIHWLVYNITKNPVAIEWSKVFCATGATILIVHWIRQSISKPLVLMCWILLMTDWNYLFYKKSLGNTEIILQIAWFMCVLPLFQNWSPNRQSKYLVFGLILGMWAKITFVLQVVPLMIAVGFVSESKWTLFKRLSLGMLVGLLPGILFIYWTETMEISVRSHDFWSMQWTRIQHALQGGSSNIRENSDNLLLWLFDPLTFFTRAYGVHNIQWHGWGTLIGYILTLIALITVRSKAVWGLVAIISIQVLILSIVAQDLHHLVIATPFLWYVLVRVLNDSTVNALMKWCIFSSFIFSHLWVLRDSPKVIDAVETPTFNQRHQQGLVEILNKHQVTHLTTRDYEVFGVVEVLMPDVQVTHAWPSISTKRWAALPQIFQDAAPGHLIVLNSSMPMIYNLQPSVKRLTETATQYGYRISLLESVEGVHLYQITR